MRRGETDRLFYRLLAVLLDYPDERLLGARQEVAEAVASLPRGTVRERLHAFVAYLVATPDLELQQRYVATFDLQRRTDLHLTYFAEGDTRRRGLALLHLKHRYAAAGLRLLDHQLPDYLPVMLEFAALAPGDAGSRLLAEHRAGLEVLRLALREQGSPYRHLIKALCLRLPRPSSVDLERIGRLIREGPPAERVGLEPFAPPEVVPTARGEGGRSR
ncbi:MAG TPA: nitrate reductase molybdenum cofactor assembly chaperone [Candidatus Dormibacteraeota bacterium]|nr:nitrate reductase molybdenum cofactor assembly chaperone [Candidatus Dormibacteraeota bacterium]